MFTVVVFFVLLGIYSCVDKVVRKPIYVNGEFKSIFYYINDTLIKSEDFTKDSILERTNYYSKNRLDSVISFDKNSSRRKKKTTINDSLSEYRLYDLDGFISAKGKMLKDSLKTGSWFFYERDSLVMFTEYIVLCDKYYLNQLIKVSKEENSIILENNNIETSYDLEVIKEGNRYKVHYYIDRIRENSQVEFYISKEDNFCQISKTESFDKGIKLPDSANEGIFYLEGLQYTKGFFYDYYLENKNKIRGRKMYFDLRNHLTPPAGVEHN